MGDCVATEGFVLVLLFEGGHVGCFLLGSECVNGSNGGCHLVALRSLCGRGFAGVRVADLGSELGSVHLLEDDLRVFADFAPELLEGDFEFDFTHSLGCFLVKQKMHYLSKDGAKVVLFL